MLSVWLIKRLEKGKLIVFTPSFQSAAAATALSSDSSPLNNSLDIKPIQMIFGSYLLWAWENFLTGINLTFDLYQGHMLKN